MNRALKVTLIVLAILWCIQGVWMFLAPNQFGALLNFAEFPKEARYIVGTVAGGLFVGFAVGFALAARDPVRHRSWVQAGLVVLALHLMGTIWDLVVERAISWNQVIVPFIGMIVFLVALVVLYPRKQVD